MIIISSYAVGDGYCDLEYNYSQFDYDGGDCSGISTNSPYADFCDLSSIANGVCDHSTNYAECHFDGGDCCINGELKWCIPRLENPYKTSGGDECKHFPL